MKTQLSCPCRNEPRHRQGFSLVEVVLALGIVSFGLVALLGLLPAGLKVLIVAKDLALEANIGQAMIAQARQTAFSNLPTFVSGSPVYFDQQGNSGEQLTASDHVYEAVVSATYNSGIGINGAATTASPATANVASVTVTVTKISNPTQPRLFCALVANNGL